MHLGGGAKLELAPCLNQPHARVYQLQLTYRISIIGAMIYTVHVLSI